MSGGATTTYGYDATGNVKTIATPDGYVARYAHDRAGRLLEVAHRTDTELLSRFTYQLDAVGNRTAMTSRLGTVSYRYDDLNRLTGACWATSCPWGAAASPAPCLDCGSAVEVPRPADPTPPDPADTFTTWTYDPVGNRLTEATQLGTTTYAYDAADRLTSRTPPGQAAIAYTYDANGNQLSAGGDTFSWDAADRLVSASANGATETYTYAGDGRRLSVTTGGSTTSWEWDLAHGLPMLALERDGTGSVTRRSTYGLGRIATPIGGQTAYHHADGLGSVVDLTDATGAPLAWAEYQPFGTVRSSGAATGAPAVPFGFAGEFTDPTGLLHLRARQYDPTAGRFLSTDPVTPLLTDPYVGTYVYVRNIPSVLTDPSGRCPWCVIGAIGGAILGGASYMLSKPEDADWDWGAFMLSTGAGAVGGAITVGSMGLAASVATAGAVASTPAWLVSATQTIVIVQGSVVGQVMDTSINALGGNQPTASRLLFDLAVSAGAPLASRWTGVGIAEALGLAADAVEGRFPK